MFSLRPALTRFGVTGPYSLGGLAWTGKGLTIPENQSKVYSKAVTQRDSKGKKIKRDIISFEPPVKDPKHGGEMLTQEELTASAPASAGSGMVSERQLFDKKPAKYVKKKNKDGTYTYCKK